MKVRKEIWEKNSEGNLILISSETYEENETELKIKIKEEQIKSIQEEIEELKKIE